MRGVGGQWYASTLPLPTLLPLIPKPPHPLALPVALTPNLKYPVSLGHASAPHSQSAPPPPIPSDANHSQPANPWCCQCPTLPIHSPLTQCHSLPSHSCAPRQPFSISQMSYKHRHRPQCHWPGSMLPLKAPHPLPPLEGQVPSPVCCSLSTRTTPLSASRHPSPPHTPIPPTPNSSQVLALQPPPLTDLPVSSCWASPCPAWLHAGSVYPASNALSSDLSSCLLARASWEVPGKPLRLSREKCQTFDHT